MWNNGKWGNRVKVLSEEAKALFLIVTHVWYQADSMDEDKFVAASWNSANISV